MPGIPLLRNIPFKQLKPAQMKPSVALRTGTSVNDKIWNLEYLTYRRAAVLSEPTQVKAFAKKYGITPEKAEQLLMQDFQTTKLRMEAAQKVPYEKGKLNELINRYGNYHPTVQAQEKRLKGFNDLVEAADPNRAERANIVKESDINQLEAEIEDLKWRNQLAGPTDPARENTERLLAEKEKRLAFLESKIPTEEIPEQRIDYTTYDHDPVERQAQRVVDTHRGPVSDTQRSQMEIPGVQDNPVVSHLKSLPAGTPSTGWMAPEQRRSDAAKQVHAQAMKEIAEATNPNVLKGKAKHKERKLLTADFDTYSGEAIMYMSDELEAINRRLTELGHAPTQPPLKSAINDAAEEHNLQTQWEDAEEFSLGGIVNAGKNVIKWIRPHKTPPPKAGTYTHLPNVRSQDLDQQDYIARIAQWAADDELSSSITPMGKALDGELTGLINRYKMEKSSPITGFDSEVRKAEVFGKDANTPNIRANPVEDTGVVRYPGDDSEVVSIPHKGNTDEEYQITLPQEDIVGSMYIGNRTRKYARELDDNFHYGTGAEDNYIDTLSTLDDRQLNQYARFLTVKDGDEKVGMLWQIQENVTPRVKRLEKKIKDHGSVPFDNIYAIAQGWDPDGKNPELVERIAEAMGRGLRTGNWDEVENLTRPILHKQIGVVKTEYFMPQMMDGVREMLNSSSDQSIKEGIAAVKTFDPKFQKKSFNNVFRGSVAQTMSLGMNRMRWPMSDTVIQATQKHIAPEKAAQIYDKDLVNSAFEMLNDSNVLLKGTTEENAARQSINEQLKLYRKLKWEQETPVREPWLEQKKIAVKLQELKDRMSFKHSGLESTDENRTAWAASRKVQALEQQKQALLDTRDMNYWYGAVDLLKEPEYKGVYDWRAIQTAVDAAGNTNAPLRLVVDAGHEVTPEISAKVRRHGVLRRNVTNADVHLRRLNQQRDNAKYRVTNAFDNEQYWVKDLRNDNVNELGELDDELANVPLEYKPTHVFFEMNLTALRKKQAESGIPLKAAAPMGGLPFAQDEEPQGYAEGGRVQPAYQDRIDNPSEHGYIVNNNGSVSTHKMGTGEMDGVFYAFPMIEERVTPDGNYLHEFDDWREALSTAVTKGNAMSFQSEKEAQAYVDQYKTPEFNAYDYQQRIKEDLDRMEGYADGGSVEPKKSKLVDENRSWPDLLKSDTFRELWEIGTQGDTKDKGQQIDNIDEMWHLLRKKYASWNAVGNAASMATKWKIRKDWQANGALRKYVEKTDKGFARRVDEHFATEDAKDAVIKAMGQRAMERVKDIASRSVGPATNLAIKGLKAARVATPLGAGFMVGDIAKDAIVDYSQSEADRIAGEGIVTPQTQQQLKENAFLQTQKEWDAKGLRVPRYADGGWHQVVDDWKTAHPDVKGWDELAALEDFRDPREHRSSGEQMDPELQDTLEARDYKDFATPERPEGDQWDQANARMLSIREGLGSVPGMWSEVLGYASYLNPLAFAYDKATGSDTLSVMPEYFKEATESANRAYMSDPHYLEESRKIYPLSGDEKFSYYATQFLADPLNLLGVKGGPALSRLTPGSLGKGKGKDIVIDPSRRELMKDAAVATGVGVVGGIPAINYLTKGAEAAAKKAPKFQERLLTYKEWLKAGKPKGEISPYMEWVQGDPADWARIGKPETGKLGAQYNNYQRAMYKDLRADLTPKQLKAFDEALRPNSGTGSWLRAQEGIPTGKPVLTEGELATTSPELSKRYNTLIPENYDHATQAKIIYDKYGLDPTITPEKYMDLLQAERARKTFKYNIDRHETTLHEKAQMQRRADMQEMQRKEDIIRDQVDQELEGIEGLGRWDKDEIVDQRISDLYANDIKNYGKTDQQMIDQHAYWGTDTETVYKEIMANNPNSKMRLKDVDKALKQAGEGKRTPGRVPDSKPSDLSQWRTDDLIQESWELMRKHKGRPINTAKDWQYYNDLEKELIKRNKLNDLKFADFPS